VIAQPSFKDPLPLDVGKIAKYWRDDILRLGMQCALAEKKTGKLVAYYHNVEDVDAKLVVYMVHFRDTHPYLDLISRNLCLIREAILNREFVGLPRCPEFKCQYKEHRCKWIGECRGN